MQFWWLEAGREIMGPNNIWSRVLESLLILLLVLLINYIAVRIVNRRVKDQDVRHRLRRGSEIVAFIVGGVLILRVWLADTESVATYLGLLSAGIAVSLSDFLSNIAGWIYIITRRPFDIGDRIQVGESAGDVVDIRFSHFALVEIGNWVDADQSTGRLLLIPNRRIFTHDLASYTAEFRPIWNEILVPLTLDSDWKEAKAFLEEVLLEHCQVAMREANQAKESANRKINLRIGRVTPIIYTKVEDYQIKLALRYLVNPRKRRSSTAEIWEAILEMIDEHPNIHLSPPIQKVVVTHTPSSS